MQRINKKLIPSLVWMFAFATAVVISHFLFQFPSDKDYQTVAISMAVGAGLSKFFEKIED